MLLSWMEIIDIIIAIVAGGYIFMDSFRSPRDEQKTFGERLLFSIAIAAPAIIFHEFGHKLVAMGLGFQATFHAAYTWLGIGVVLKLLSFPFLILVPAYVSVAGAAGMDGVWIALAGPLINCVLWLSCWALLASKKKWSRNTEAVLYYSKTINMFLFIFNLIPIPGFDGFNALKALGVF
jgi:Zn-dependent protease